MLFISTKIILGSIVLDRYSSNIYTEEEQLNGHKISLAKKTSRKWLSFPGQHHHHDASLIHNTQSGVGKGSIEKEELLYFDNKSFWSSYSDLLGLSSDIVMIEVGRMPFYGTDGGSIVTFTQMLHGFRVHGGEYKVLLGNNGNILSVHGLPSPAPVIIGFEARDLDAAKAASDHIIDKAEILEAINDYYYLKHQILITAIVHKDMDIVWFMAGLTHGASSTPVLAYHVNGGSTSPYSSFDAFIGVSSMQVLLYMDKTEKLSPFSDPLGIDVGVYDDPTNTWIFDSSVDSYPTSDNTTNILIDNTLYMRNMIYALSNGTYESWAGADTVWRIEANLAVSNAYFDGSWGIHFGVAYSTDDVIAHEWGHGYTQTVNNLNYIGESGAMNEAFSDIYGESVDILNADTTDPDTMRSTTEQCAVANGGSDVGTRWVLGEDVSGTSGAGIRDMYYPECFGDPGTVDSGYFMCGTGDHNGVHTNSGVLNRLFATLVDGGKYGDVVIDSIGLTKALNIFWRTSTYLTSTSQFLDFGLALDQVCSASVGSVLYEPSVFNNTIIHANFTITTADCLNIGQALNSSGMLQVDAACPTVKCDGRTAACQYDRCPVTDQEESIAYEVLCSVVAFVLLCVIYTSVASLLWSLYAVFPLVYIAMLCIAHTL